VAAIYVKLVLTMFFWGGTFVAGRSLAVSVHPFAAAFLRFAIAATVLLAVLYRKYGAFPIVSRRTFLLILCLSLTGVFTYNLFFFWGLQKVDAGRASVIIANNPVFIAIFASLFFRERLGWIKLMGVPISVTGAVIAIARGDVASLLYGGFGFGDLLIVGCVISWVSFSLIGKIVLSATPPLVAITYSSTIGALLLFAPAVLSGMFDSISAYTFMDWAWIFFLGVFGTAVGFVWYYQGIEKIGATRAGLFINLVPINAISMAYFILCEPVTLSLAIGITLVLSGVYLTNNGVPELRKITLR